MQTKEKFEKLSDEEMLDVKSNTNDGDPPAPDYYEDDENPMPEPPDPS